MVTIVDILLGGSRLVALGLALGISLTSYRTYRRTGASTFGFTMIGFAFVTLGLAVESLLLGRVALTLTEIHAVESLFFAIGFVALYASLHVRFDG
jgi:hypothetical protein